MVQSGSAALRIGTRGSPLALEQARQVRDRIAALHGIDPAAIAIEVIRTSGDAIQDRVLSEAGGKGLFTKEIEEALFDGRIDMAVHSAKDMPTVLPTGLVIGACLAREDARDCFISRVATGFADLPQGATLGTASLRRQALARRLRPDLQIVPLRGNVDTRLRKIDQGVADATLLALAGLKRLGKTDAARSVLGLDEFMPAVGQGVIAVEIRAADEKVAALVAAIDHADTMATFTAERAFLTVLDGSCRTPIAGHATLSGDRLQLKGLVIRPDGSELVMATRAGDRKDAEWLGADAGRELKGRAGPDFFSPR
ncbi:MAG: hydroxymethylbilane synthase [Pseudorhodoplanes sp.]